MTDTAPKTGEEFYRTTVFLPKTDFPMRGNLPEKEPGILQKWQEMDLYKRLREGSKGRKKFILHDGPPYANGNIHIGHAINKILKDTINRYWQMTGHDAPYVPGWDCHGLPIEWKIEEQYRAAQKNKDDVDIVSFRAECRAYADHWVRVQSDEFQRLGVLGDFKNPYLTMTHTAEAKITAEIHKFLKNGGLYKGLRPVMWSVVEKTALADAEIEYHEHKSITVWVKFPIVSTAVKDLQDAQVVIWTTTPWTLPSNRGIAFGSDFDYAVFTVLGVDGESRARVGDRLVLALSRANEVKEKVKITAWEQGPAFKGSSLSGTVCTHPLRGQGYDFDVPLLPAPFVTDDTGTGFVHIAPSHGADDFYLGRDNGLEITDNVDDAGVFRPHVPLFAGKPVLTEKGEMGDANFAVIKAIDETGRLLAKGTLKHEYPHSWRSKAPLIFRTTPQWFISMDTNDLRQKSLKAISETHWVPAQSKNRIAAMIEQRPDWCISRQRAWGVPIALFIDKKTGLPLKDDTVLNRIVDIFSREGSDSWFKRPAQDFLGDGYEAEDFERVDNIVDVWFESGSTHAFVLEERDDLHWPADLYLEGSDQHRGWFHSSLLVSCGTRDRAPYESVLTHGFILDEKGHKMSKSLGNVISPQDMMKQYGADILRLWSITADYSEDTRIGKATMETNSDMYRRIRNTFRFLLGALDGFTEAERVAEADFGKMPELERLVLHWIAELDTDIRACIRDYDYNRLTQRLHNFCATELSAFYFDIRKDRLYCDRPDLFERRATRTVMALLLEHLTLWFAPVLCFTAEEVWANRPKGIGAGVESVHLMTFPETPSAWRNDTLATKWEKIRAVRRVITGALEPKRLDKTIGSSLEAHPRLYLSAEMMETTSGTDWAEVSITSQVTTEQSTPPDGAFSLPDVPGVGVVFAPAEGKKCARCWKVLPTVGNDPEYPDITPRDADAVRYILKHARAAA